MRHKRTHWLRWGNLRPKYSPRSCGAAQDITEQADYRHQLRTYERPNGALRVVQVRRGSVFALVNDVTIAYLSFIASKGYTCQFHIIRLGVACRSELNSARTGTYVLRARQLWRGCNMNIPRGSMSFPQTRANCQRVPIRRVKCSPQAPLLAMRVSRLHCPFATIRMLCTKNHQ